MLNQIIKDQESWDMIDTFMFQFKNVTLQDSYLHLIPKKHQNKMKTYCNYKFKRKEL